MEKNKRLMDEIDRKLLNLLQENSRITIRKLSEKLYLSTTPIYERIKKLEKSGLIKQYITLLDPKKIDRNLVVFISINLARHTKEVVEAFEDAIAKLDEVSECYYISGNFDFLLKVYCRDMDDYHDFLTNKLSVIENISQFYSSFVLTNSKLSYTFKL
ncbi:Lrp/AsnC family transcriptional regulator [Candidatus Sulfidibacterium hydrothermale]|uniref:Lrp/AsnC family transcriptional regulator n=1 Tax=Candidatus Sulfidibacterium hydrothermale TaxID=2875962 RepID=UPI001F0A09B0|nr:Lrp/AsnC family transcriptional regulator [Candidatus Sulfidibacterium hydrothermale]UBM62234.1 Lrp/AsnC family transcriptional regulator [Candidatus Sulfidibacterium hydrothermale]